MSSMNRFLDLACGMSLLYMVVHLYSVYNDNDSPTLHNPVAHAFVFHLLNTVITPNILYVQLTSEAIHSHSQLGRPMTAAFLIIFLFTSDKMSLEFLDALYGRTD